MLIIDIIWDIMYREIRIYINEGENERRYFLGQSTTLGM